MDKSILKKIAKRYAKSILINTDGIGFNEQDILDQDEIDYVMNEIEKNS